MFIYEKIDTVDVYYNGIVFALLIFFYRLFIWCIMLRVKKIIAKTIVENGADDSCSGAGSSDNIRDHDYDSNNIHRTNVPRERIDSANVGGRDIAGVTKSFVYCTNCNDGIGIDASTAAAYTILPESVCCANVRQQVKNKVNAYSINALPTIHNIRYENPIFEGFGRLNEVEYSSSAKFHNVYIDRNLDRLMDTAIQINTYVRYYFENDQMLYVNDTEILNKCINADTDIPLPCTTILRLDYTIEALNSIAGNDNDDVDALVMRPTSATAKLKLVKQKFNYSGSTYKLAGAIEADVHNILPSIESLKTYSKCRYIYYWYVHINGFQYRVAFRENIKHHEQESNLRHQHKQHHPYYTTYDFNVECEDAAISPIEFIVAYNLLFKYYKTQYIMNHGVVRPCCRTLMASQVMDLTDYQRHLFSTMDFRPTVIVSHCDDAVMSEPMQRMQEFVKSLAIETYRMFGNYDSDDDFVQIDDDAIVDDDGIDRDDDDEDDDDNDSMKNYFFPSLAGDCCDPIVISNHMDYGQHLTIAQENDVNLNLARQYPCPLKSSSSYSMVPMAVNHDAAKPNGTFEPTDSESACVSLD